MEKENLLAKQLLLHISTKMFLIFFVDKNAFMGFFYFTVYGLLSYLLNNALIKVLIIILHAKTIILQIRLLYEYKFVEETRFFDFA